MIKTFVKLFKNQSTLNIILTLAFFKIVLIYKPLKIHKIYIVMTIFRTSVINKFCPNKKLKSFQIDF